MAIQLDLLANTLGYHQSTIRRILKKYHKDEKKNSDETKEARRKYVNSFINWASRYGQDNIYFIDEIGYKIEMRAKYRQSKIGTKAIETVVEKQNNNISYAASMNRTKPFYFIQQNTPFTTISFLRFITGLIQKLQKNKVEKALLIMDNVNFYKSDSIASFINKEGFDYLLLPLYTPDLNPIGKLFHQWKTDIEKEKCRDRFDLDKAINSLWSKITKQNCIDYFVEMSNYFEPSIIGRNIE
ncbi:hypothetical protein CONCODRAFT_2843 [Conidiobolus coronatus NRRL 28638]|uniref:Tc1-like transposase DDE domain-containing protein n=1 Tax=Conidiobolus coronatus (strain ATCC 28846 / CBS 209.66 / NRRL 28638) TaxID=796925 RepID=A0A137PGS1_CONC2|nr:hypothetical protein CONCODRAFT_2843 [Conidiobolus coronatus NRRL 28638]|eukprot:KXN74131.1 hypothetical protein CONCODRAFT_2843 [Conidiobolus coronatus NRRL 28638]